MKTECILDMKDWGSGSVALWGAVSPVYNTASQLIEEGVHVHARHSIGAAKEIDDNYVQVVVKNWKMDEKPLTVTAKDAIAYMVASVFDLQMKRISCPACGQLHLDEGWFSVNPHQKHVCIYCRRAFFDLENGIGNPLAGIEMPPDALVAQPTPVDPLECRQKDYPGGIQVWGTNPAVFWKNQQRGSTGIHVHAFDENNDIAFDETVPSLSIDGLFLDEDMVRMYMAQSVVPHLYRSVCHILCPKCGTGHFDRGTSAHIPHKLHTCNHCHYKFEHGDGAESIGNPLVNTIARLKAFHRN